MINSLYLTMSEILKISPLDQVDVIAGTGGLDRQLTFVSVMEVPEMIDMVRPGELLLTTGYPFFDKEDLINSIIFNLNKKGCVGLGIKPSYLKQIPNQMIVEANKMDFPLLSIPLTMVLNDIIQPLMETIINKQLYLLKYSEKVRQSLTSIVLRGQGLRNIISHLTEIVKNPISVIDTSGELLATDPFILNNIHYQYLFEKSFEKKGGKFFLRKNLEIGQDNQSQNTPEYSVHEIKLSNGKSINELYKSIQVGGENYGYLLIWELNQPTTEMDKEALTQACAVIALDVVRQKAIKMTEFRFRSEFLNDIISGEIRDRVIATQRATSFGWAVNEFHSCVVLDIENQPPFSIQHNKSETHPISELAHDTFRAAARSIIKSIDDKIIVSSRGKNLVLIFRSENTKLTNIFEQKTALIMQSINTAYKDLSIKAGIGDPCNSLFEINQSYKQALLAIRVGQRTSVEQNIYLFCNLGVYTLLFGLDEVKLKELYTKELGKIAEYDSNNGTELLKTLEVIFDSNLNLRLAAERLFIHYNTLKYRVKKIENIYGDFRKNWNKRFSLELGIRAMRLLHER